MNFLTTIRSLAPVQQLILAAAVLGIVLVMGLLVRNATQEPMTLLYSGIEAATAGEIIDELQQAGIPYEIKGEAIYVPEGKRDSVRFTLAQQGLPRPTVQGYELLDKVNGFSVTSEMYNAAYWRAKEGELTRTILAIPGVASARVHIGANLRSGFMRSQAPPTASVTVSTAYNLSKAQAEAIQYMVALAVPGLNAADVAVIDTARGILAGPKSETGEEPELEAASQSSQLEQKILSLLEPRVGTGNVRVSATVDVSREVRRQSQVTFDPSSRVIRSRSANDTNRTSTGAAAGVTVASNLPEAEPAGPGTSATDRISTETVSFEINETRTEVEIRPGEVKKIALAVLLNASALGIDPAAADAEARQAQMVEEFRRLVTSAAGIDAARGDQVSVEVMPFQPVSEEQMTAAPGLVEQLLERYLWSGLQAALLALIVIALGLGVIRPMLVGGRAARLEDEQAASPQPEAEATAETDPVSYLNTFANGREEETAALLQRWLEEDQEPLGAGRRAGETQGRQVAVNE